jgi:superfamily II DNA or RNA helicase
MSLQSPLQFASPVAPLPQLWDYQQQMVHETLGLWQQRVQSLALISPTGSGKTVTFADIVAKVLRNPDKRGFLAVHREPLLDQTYAKLAPYGIPCGFIKSGRSEDPHARLQIASIQSLPNREWWTHYQPNLVVFDEAHRTGFFKTALEIRHKIFSRAAFLYVTASPWRLGTSQLGDLCDAAVVGPMPLELIRRQRLSKPIYYRLPPPDLSNVELNQEGDFDLEQLQIACNTPENISHAVAEWLRLVPGRLTFAFCTGKEHALNLAAAFIEAGVPARSLLSGEEERSQEELKELFDDFQNRKFLVLVTVDKASEGVDCPAAEVALCCRPTQSPSLFVQQIGRVLRIYTGKLNAYILDQAGNCRRHFYLENLTPEDFLLVKGRLKKKLGQAPQKCCPKCGAVLHASLRSCPSCKFEFSTQNPKIVGLCGELEIDIPEPDNEAFWAFRRLLKQTWKARSSPEIATIKFKEEFGFSPPLAWGQGACLGTASQHLYQYRTHLQAIATLDQHSPSWIDQWLRCEMG